MEQGSTIGENSKILPTEMLSRYYAGHGAEHDSLKQQISAVEEERNESMRLAAEPYAEILGDLQARILGELELMSPERLERLFRDEVQEASPLYRAACELLLAQYEIDIPTFIASLLSDNHSSRTITDQLKGISALGYAAEANQELPILYISLKWFEEEEVRFDRQPRNNTNAFWMKQLTGTLARAGEIVVGNEQIALPDSLTSISKPCSITLELSGVNKFESVYDWGSLRSEQRQLDQDSVKILSLLTSFDRQHDMISWEASQKQDFSLLREGLHKQMLMESEPKIFCIYGYDSVRHALQQLGQDESIPEDMKSILQGFEKEL